MKALSAYLTVEILLAGVIIIFGALVNATARYRTSRASKDSNFGFVDFLILIPISGFSGVIFGLIASVYFSDQVLVLAASGLGAFLGIEGLNKIGDMALNALSARVKK